MIFFISNPGTEKREGATLAHALQLREALSIAVMVPVASIKRDPKRDDDRGYFAFRIEVPDRDAIEVDIPGDDPAQVMGEWPFVSRRLYVDGSSWFWSYAINIIRRTIEGTR